MITIASTRRLPHNRPSLPCKDVERKRPVPGDEWCIFLSDILLDRLEQCESSVCSCPLCGALRSLADASPSTVMLSDFPRSASASVLRTGLVYKFVIVRTEGILAAEQFCGHPDCSLTIGWCIVASGTAKCHAPAFGSGVYHIDGQGWQERPDRGLESS